MRLAIGVIVAGMIMAGGLATRAMADSAPDNAVCAQEATREEKLQSIPDHLLRAISLVESGRWDPDRKEDFAWPWTVTAEGDGHFLPTKQAAMALVRQLQARGIVNIDVGCMQVNLQAHPDAFDSLDLAFDPAVNVAYAARFLVGLDQSTGNWPTAAGYYHSQTPPLAAAYRVKVAQAWSAIRTGNDDPVQLASLTDSQGDQDNQPPAGLVYLQPVVPPYDPQVSIRAAAEKNAAALAQTEADKAEAKKIADAWRQAKLVEWQLRKKQPPQQQSTRQTAAVPG